MTIQVVYKNKAKSGNQDVIAVFANEKFQIKNTSDFFSKNETSSLPFWTFIRCKWNSL